MVDENDTFSITVSSVNAKLSLKKKNELRKQIGFWPLKGKANLSTPTHQFFLFAEYHNNDKRNGQKPVLYRYLLGRLVR